LYEVLYDAVGSDARVATDVVCIEVAELLLPYINLRVFAGQDVGADISEMAEAGVPAAGLKVNNYFEQRPVYFWFHHTNADTPDKIEPVVFNQCLGTIAAVAYVIADMAETLPRMRML
jgi:carboxypeptidase Q